MQITRHSWVNMDIYWIRLHLIYKCTSSNILQCGIHPVKFAHRITTVVDNRMKMNIDGHNISRLNLVHWPKCKQTVCVQEILKMCTQLDLSQNQ